MHLPNAPDGFSWRLLQAQDAELLIPHWQQLDRAQGNTPCWRSWTPSLINIHTGTFSHDLLQVIGLFDAGGTLVACAAEAVSLDNGQLSEINFTVSSAWRNRGFGLRCLRAGLDLARFRGSCLARIECDAKNIVTLNMLYRYGTTPAKLSNGAACMQATLGLTALDAWVIAMKRLFRR